ncbi:electron transfer flavoprotein subunit beta/FixA family protein [Alkalicoccobacillus porphyridii]|uniref:Electron transfer flavoprotein subunit beta n=1 Tax=Alkalicoccobacillus porphyridii TaxID=2597270 RepID=A0A553ZWZ9_9BACI|nr:electron transfer flavoprotein subunit beta/FixA family protein [Alkalicoccobacillus porphyridii]TSB45977.1 electron transfer flavoprotein subunit beta/FixA family protein [Alkalicoccobacillus porphyridii]
MNIYVLVKQTFDTEEKVVIEDGAISEDGVQFVLNPYDEYAVEEAIQLKEQTNGSVYVLSIGTKRSAEALRTALAMGADEAILISDDRIGSDETSLSKVLAAYLQTQSFDLILGGYFSVDNGAGQVGIRVADLLNIPHAGSITNVTVDQGKATVLRDAEGDTEELEIVLPALFTAQQGLNEPRYPSLPGIMKAKKKPFTTLSLDDLDITEAELSPKTVRMELSLPAKRTAGEMLNGDSSEQVKQLISHLKSTSNLF